MGRRSLLGPKSLGTRRGSFWGIVKLSPGSIPVTESLIPQVFLVSQRPESSFQTLNFITIALHIFTVHFLGGGSLSMYT